MLIELEQPALAAIIEQKASQSLSESIPVPEETTEQALIPRREELLSLLEDPSHRIIAQTAARAQMLFDCQAITPALPEEIRTDCAEEFDAAIAALQAVTHSLHPKHRHVVTFATNDATLTPEAYKQIGQITSQLLALEQYQIHVTGHAAPAQTPKEAWDLALKRAERVTDAMIEAGVSQSRIQTSSLGSIAPPQDTANESLDHVDIRIHTP